MGYTSPIYVWHFSVENEVLSPVSIKFCGPLFSDKRVYPWRPLAAWFTQFTLLCLRCWEQPWLISIPQQTPLILHIHIIVLYILTHICPVDDQFICHHDDIYKYYIHIIYIYITYLLYIYYTYFKYTYLSNYWWIHMPWWWWWWRWRWRRWWWWWYIDI